MIDPGAAYRAAGRQAVEEAFHRFLIDLGVGTETRLRLVAELRALDAANPFLAYAWIAAETGSKGQPLATVVIEPPERPLFTLPIGKWRHDFADLLRAELAIERMTIVH